MRIIVNHLTRMQPGYICVAGIDIQRNNHVRPVIAGARLSIDLLKRNGGAFDIAAVVDLGQTQHHGTPPEIEDRVFDPDQLVAVEDLNPGSYWRLLKTVSYGKLADIFGKDLKGRSNGCAVDEGKGNASLGCLQPEEPPEVYINGWGKVRARVSDGSFEVDLSVTDLRFYQDDQKTPRSKVVAKIQRRIQDGIAVILSVGLARAFRAGNDTARRHWLQLNNVHLEDDPVCKAEQFRKYP